MLNNHIESYLTGLNAGLMALDRQAIWGVVEALMTAWRERRQVFVLGNGGSAALASHMVNDLSKIVVPGQPRFRAIALTDNVALIMAWANDSAYEHVFAEQLQNLCQPGDLVIATSCSGNSPNVLNALQAARNLGARTIGFTGDIGGKLRDAVDLCVYAPVPLIGQQEDIHLILNHAITNVLTSWVVTIAQRSAEPMRAVVLAAGEGTRLRPLTLTRPKPMLPINGKPLLHYTLEWLRRYGIREVGINLHHRPDVIVDYLGNGARLDLQIVYSHEERMMGTAGAIRKLGSFADGRPLVVVYGDVLTDLDLGALIAAHNQCVSRDPTAGVTLSLYHVPNPTEVGLVGLDHEGRVTRFVEKPRPDEVFTDLANAGVLIIEPDVIKHIPPDTFYDFGHDLFPMLLRQGVSLYGWVVPEGTYVMDIGSPEKYAQAQRDWHERHERFETVQQ
ncbi:MAG: sugar phosphate nucleotidyltransferase [Chloroflexi bacterium]|nr:sugar phosphate nucleotidyltransferase [Chloroflexota bacterium]